jgi:serine/threonine protein kinase
MTGGRSRGAARDDESEGGSPGAATSARWERVKAVFQGALDRPPAERAAFVASACAGDAALQVEVESLLAVSDGGGRFLSEPAASRVEPGGGAPDTLGRLKAALAARYVVEREVGRGGMATVYLAHDVRHTRLVALKVLDPGVSESLGTARFLREIELAAGLSHPHAVPLYDSGEADGLLYFVMPYIDGETLRVRLARERALPLEETVRIARQIADALDYAHEQGVVHRDVKPENVLLRRGHALVTDFGVARAVTKATKGSARETLTQTGLAIGTPAYMSPEQAAGEDALDGRSDVYALGCVVFEMLTGSTPFTGTSAEQMAARFRGSPPPVRVLRRELPAGLDGVVAKALALAPAARFGTAGEFAAALTGAVGNAALGEGPSRLSGARARAAARRPRLIGAALVGACALAAGGWWVAARREASPTATADRKMLAVLPFDNLGRPEDEYFADGITEEIASRLSALGGVGVISRTSTKQYKNTTKPLKEVARELGADYVLEGTVRWDKGSEGPGRVRVTPQLIRVSDDSHLWADGYDADADDIFAVQARVAEAVAGALGVALGAGERQALTGRPTESFDAHSYYLQGRALADDAWLWGERNKRSAKQAIGLFERALALDSNFVEAHLGLADAYSALRASAGDAQDRASRQAIERARQLAPESPAVLVRMSSLALADGDSTLARELLERAVKRDPNHSDAWGYLGMIQWDAQQWTTAFESLDRALELDPRAAGTAWVAYSFGLEARRYAAAERYLERAVALRPDEPMYQMERGWLAVASAGDTARARRLFHDAVVRFGVVEVARVAAAQALAWLLVPSLDSARLDTLARASVVALGGDTVLYYRLKADLFGARGAASRSLAYRDSQRVALEREATGAAGLEARWAHGSLARVYAQLGRRGDALRAARQAAELQAELVREKRFVPAGKWLHYTLAQVYALLGDGDAAARELEPLLSVPSQVNAWSLRLDPTYDAVRSHPAFQRLLERAR